MTNAPVPWPAERWNAADDALPAQMTPNLKTILQPVVDQGGFTTDSSVAFIINGAITAPGRRVAKSFDGSVVRGTVRPQAPKLIIQYQAPKSSQPLLVCGNVADADNECKVRVKTTVADIANTCKIADTCTCRLTPNSAKFSDVCNQGCDRVDVRPECNPDNVKQATSMTRRPSASVSPHWGRRSSGSGAFATSTQTRTLPGAA